MKTNFTQNWLTTLVGLIPETQTAVFFIQDGVNQTLQLLAKWPENSTDIYDLNQIVELSLLQNKPVSMPNVQYSDGQFYDYFAHPVFIRSELLGIVAIRAGVAPKEKHGSVVATLEQAGQWLALAQNNEDRSKDFYIPLIQLLASCIEQNSYRELLITLVTKLTQVLGCDQVVLGEFKNRHCNVVVLSNSAKFDERSNFIQKIANAMDEAIEQDSLIQFPDSGKIANQRAHQELARKFGSGALLTIPLATGESIFGAITLLRSEDKPFDELTVQLSKMLMALIMPYLELKKRDEQNILIKIFKALKHNLTGILGLRHAKIKLLALLASFSILSAAVIESDFKITADAVLEGKMQRVVAAPIDGYLLAAMVRAGDTIHTGEVMATLDDSNLQLELSKLNGQLQKFRREYREAMSTNDLVKVRVISAQIDQANAEMELTRQQLQKISLTAPYDSVVIEGDLSQMLGSPVERGDVLFKIAPLQGYRIVLKVGEGLISYVKEGQKGVLVLSSMPERNFEIIVDKITGVAKAEDNKNIFRVEASLPNAPDILRPGMEGIGKINAGKKRLLWIWTHEISNWLRLWFWSWWF